ncbi:site-specific integrase [Ascidiaceihabitans sp.]|uniref:tyrosine-type recombinase/integrase n=1 Tax=Ascidiaceihabitans sp. TaxID=1872644 RepID=UPI00329907B5
MRITSIYPGVTKQRHARPHPALRPASAKPSQAKPSQAKPKKRALALMPSTTPQQLRDKAIFALLCLTGVRIAALVSLKIKHVDLQEQSVTQNPREVALYGSDDPLFSATAITAKSNSGFEADGFTRGYWKSTEPVRKIVRIAFEAAGVPNYGPHSFRHMLARHIAKNCTSVAELVATSQNLGHTDVLTTLRSYGQISREDQRKLVTGKTDV